jgi:hypothetical protein
MRDLRDGRDLDDHNQPVNYVIRRARTVVWRDVAIEAAGAPGVPEPRRERFMPVAWLIWIGVKEATNR